MSVFTFRERAFRFLVLNSSYHSPIRSQARRMALLAVSLRRPGKNRKNALFFSEFKGFGTSQDISEFFSEKAIQDLTNFALIFCCVRCAGRFIKQYFQKSCPNFFCSFNSRKVSPEVGSFLDFRNSKFRNSGFPEIQDSLQLSSVRVYEFNLFKELAHEYYPL
jgi:hypothetical protein